MCEEQIQKINYAQSQNVEMTKFTAELFEGRDNFC